MRPTFEYCSNLWSPYRISDIVLIESVQKRFTKRLNYMSELQYADRLKELKAEPLEKRRLKCDMLMYYKIIHGLIDLPVEDFFSFRNGVTRNNGACIYRGPFQSNAERYYFNNRGINAWNALPSSVVNAASPFIFKRLLENIDFSKFLRP